MIILSWEVVVMDRAWYYGGSDCFYQVIILGRGLLSWFKTNTTAAKRQHCCQRRGQKHKKCTCQTKPDRKAEGGSGVFSLLTHTVATPPSLHLSAKACAAMFTSATSLLGLCITTICKAEIQITNSTPLLEAETLWRERERERERERGHTHRSRKRQTET